MAPFSAVSSSFINGLFRSQARWASWSAGIGFDLSSPGEWLYQQAECL